MHDGGQSVFARALSHRERVAEGRVRESDFRENLPSSGLRPPSPGGRRPARTNVSAFKTLITTFLNRINTHFRQFWRLTSFRNVATLRTSAPGSSHPLHVRANVIHYLPSR